MTGRACTVNPFERPNWSAPLMTALRRSKAEGLRLWQEPPPMTPEQHREYRHLCECLGPVEARRIMFGGMG